MIEEKTFTRVGGNAADHGRRAHHRRHEPAARGDGGEARSSARTCSSASTCSRSAAAAARAPRGRAGAGRASCCGATAPRPTSSPPAARQALGRYAYPGNVRELEHTLERALILAGSDPIEPRAPVVRAPGAMRGRRARAAGPSWVPRDPARGTVARGARARADRCRRSTRARRQQEPGRAAARAHAPHALLADGAPRLAQPGERTSGEGADDVAGGRRRVGGGPRLNDEHAARVRCSRISGSSSWRCCSRSWSTSTSTPSAPRAMMISFPVERDRRARLARGREPAAVARDGRAARHRQAAHPAPAHRAARCASRSPASRPGISSVRSPSTT